MAFYPQFLDAEGRLWRCAWYDYLMKQDGAEKKFYRAAHIVDPTGTLWDYEIVGSITRKTNFSTACVSKKDGSLEENAENRRIQGFKRMSNFMAAPRTHKTWHSIIRKITGRDLPPLWCFEKVTEVRI